VGDDAEVVTGAAGFRCSFQAGRLGCPAREAQRRRLDDIAAKGCNVE
jgi:hypothetical protein